MTHFLPRALPLLLLLAVAACGGLKPGSNSHLWEYTGEQDFDRRSEALVLVGITFTTRSHDYIQTHFDSYWYGFDPKAKRLVPRDQNAILGGSANWRQFNENKVHYIVAKIDAGTYLLGATNSMSLKPERIAPRGVQYTQLITGLLDNGRFHDRGRDGSWLGFTPSWLPADAQLTEVKTPHFVSRPGEVLYIGDLIFDSRPVDRGGRIHPRIHLKRVAYRFDEAKAFMSNHFSDFSDDLELRRLVGPDGGTQ